MRARALAFGTLAWLAACRSEDAYLGGSHEAYVCGLRCAIEQGAPPDAGDWFWNPESDLGAAPEVVYPLHGSAHPVDLRQLTVQFRRGRADFRVFRVRVEAPEQRLSFDFFTPCIAVGDDGCRYLLDSAVWDAARAELVGKELRLTVTGSTAADGVQKSSPAVALSVVDTNLRNKGFYYWASVPQYSGDRVPRTGIFRLPFGADQAEPFLMPGTPTNERECGACHSVSSDGSTIAFTARDYDDGARDQRSGSLVVKVTAQPNRRLFEPAVSYDSSMMALTSDGKRVLVAYDKQLVLRSGESNGRYEAGDVITRLGAEDLGGKAGYFPEFSPDDDAVVVTLSDDPDSAIAVRAGDIAVLSFDASRGEFGEPTIIVEGNEDIFHFYPTWSPDGRYVAFASAPRGLDDAGQPRKSYDQKKARLRLVSREGGEVYELANATHQVEQWSTYPKFAPFSIGQTGSQFFLTFNSKINYGLLLDNVAQTDDLQRVAQLWMSEVDVTKLPEDPSSAPIWLPFQDPTAPGHLGIWTKEVKCRTDQGVAACALGQKCVNSVCVVVPK